MVRIGGKAARTAGAGLFADGGRSHDWWRTLLGSSRRATTGLTLGYLAAEGREDVGARCQDVLSSAAVIGTYGDAQSGAGRVADWSSAR